MSISRRSFLKFLGFGTAAAVAPSVLTAAPTADEFDSTKPTPVKLISTKPTTEPRYVYYDVGDQWYQRTVRRSSADLTLAGGLTLMCVSNHVVVENMDGTFRVCKNRTGEMFDFLLEPFINIDHLTSMEIRTRLVSGKGLTEPS